MNDVRFNDRAIITVLGGIHMGRNDMNETIQRFRDHIDETMCTGSLVTRTLLTQKEHALRYHCMGACTRYLNGQDRKDMNTWRDAALRGAITSELERINAEWDPSKQRRSLFTHVLITCQCRQHHSRIYINDFIVHGQDSSVKIVLRLGTLLHTLTTRSHNVLFLSTLPRARTLLTGVRT